MNRIKWTWLRKAVLSDVFYTCAPSIFKPIVLGVSLCLLSSCTGGLSVLFKGGHTQKDSTIPFSPGETLTYKMIWNLIPVGYFTVKVEDPKKVNNVEAWHFSMQVKTNGFADTFYKVRNSVDAYAHPSLKYSLAYEFDQRQGKTKEHAKLTFDTSPPRVRYIKDDKDKGWVELPHLCVDPLTLFYVVRTHNIQKVGETIPIWVSDGETHIESQVAVLKKESITVNDTVREAYLVQPDLKEMHSVFKRSKGAKVKVWVTDDKYKIPLKVASRVVVGSFQAKLVKFETGRDDEDLNIPDSKSKPEGPP